MKKLFPVLFLLLSQSLIAQKPCSLSVFRQFDFWVGNWEAFATNGKKAGDSKISIILDSCIVLEEWTSTQAGYAGKSFNTYNATTGKWQQYWVDNKSGVTEYFDGRLENNNMVFQTTNTKQPNGQYQILKMTFYNLGPNKVRQFGQSSADSARTWKTDFDLEYRRKKQ